MDKQLFQEMPPELRAEHLSANCDKIEEFEYSKQFSQEEIDEFKTKLPANMIEVDKHDAVLQKAKELHKELTKEPKQQINYLLENIRTGRKMVKEQCYKMVDTVEMKTGYYNQEGELVFERPAFPEERQRTTMQIVREATNE
jgi:hypothetical protein